jgi:putative ABC transport system permease protein
MSVRLRKSFTDISRRRARSAIIALAIAIPVAGLTAVGVASDSLSTAYAYTVSARGGPDVVVATDRADATLVNEIARAPGVRGVQDATVLTTQWQVAAAPGSVQLRIVGYGSARRVAPQRYQLVSGRPPRRGGEIAMEYGDLGLQRFRVGERVTVLVAGGTESLRVVGLTRTAGVDPATSGLALAYMQQAALQRLPAFGFTPGPVQRQPFRSHELSLHVANPSAYQATVHGLGPILHARNVALLGVLPPAAAASESQLQGILTLIRALLLVALLLAAVLVGNAVSALITSQTEVIGTLKALGARPVAVAEGYALTLLTIASAATAVGIGVGIPVGALIAARSAAAIPLAPGPTVVSTRTVAFALAVGLAGPLLAGAIPLWLGTRISVRQALSDWGTSVAPETGRPRTVGLSGSHHSRVPQTVWLGLRHLGRRRARAAVSIVAVAIAASSFFVVQSVAASVSHSINEVWSSYSADVEVYVGGNNSYRTLSRLLAPVQNIRTIERVGWLGSETAWGKVAVWGIEPRSQLHHARVTSGRWFRSGESGVCLISTDLAARAHLRLGASIDVPGPEQQRSERCTVIGTVHEPVDSLGQVGALDLPVNDLYRLEGAPARTVGDYTNRVLIEAKDRSPAAADRLARAIDALGRQAAAAGKNGPIAEVFTFRSEVVRQQRSFLPVYFLLLAVSGLVAAVGCLALADSLTGAVFERRREIGVLRALGASGRRIATVFYSEATALSLIAWLVAAAAGIPLAHLFVDLFRRRVMPIDFQLDLLALAVMVGVTLLLAALASILPSRIAATLRPADLLRSE